MRSHHPIVRTPPPLHLFVCAILIGTLLSGPVTETADARAPGTESTQDTAERHPGWKLRGSLPESSGPPLRRKTQTEYAHALRDLLYIDKKAARLISQSLPPEADAAGFDTLAENQGISALHIRSYLEAADRALGTALVLGARPTGINRTIDYTNGLMQFYAQSDIFGLGVIKMLDDAAVQFDEAVCTYTMDSERSGLSIIEEGRYRVTLDGYRHQADTLVVMTLFKGKTQGIVASLDELIGSWDLTDDETRTVSVETFLQPGDLVAPCVAETDVPPEDPFYVYYNSGEYAQNYTGEGVAFRSMTVEGPLIDQWPPTSTQELLTGIEVDENGELVLVLEPEEHLREIVAAFAPRAFGRPVDEDENSQIAALGIEALDEGRPFLEALRRPLLAILTSPKFLYQLAPANIPSSYDFAGRLAALVWRGPPDEELLAVASEGLLDDPYYLSLQVDRLLDDPRSFRLVEDFAGQAWRLDEFRATTPSAFLYPEYNAQLGQSMLAETTLFLAALLAEDRGADQLIDSDFTFVNRPLAQLYGIEGITGQEMQRIELPPDSLRGGLITQASILKITANGTSTSPVPRGNFILEHLLGTPMPPPPAGVPGLEPDTRGTSTIREQLEKHRTQPACASCHVYIDPPGFALESFDAVGAFRDQYRNTRDVDPSGVTTTGRSFAGIAEYKQILLDESLDLVARHLFEELLTFAIGAEIEHQDHAEVDLILDRLRGEGYGIRGMIHEIVASSMFRKSSGREEPRPSGQSPSRENLGRRVR